MQSQTTSIETARTVLGQYPQEIVGTLNIGYTSLEWLGAVLQAIELLHEKGGSSGDIKRLTSLGSYLATDIGNLLDNEREKIAESIKAAEDVEVEA